MKTFIFTRSVPYSYLLPGQSLYQSFNSVATGTIDVDVSDGAAEYFNQHLGEMVKGVQKVYCSPRLSSRRTAKLSGLSPVVLTELKEVSYSMSDFISEQEFFIDDRPQVDTARQLFVKALVQDKLSEKYGEIMSRTQRVLNLLKQENAEKVLIISHGFILKIIEAVIRDPLVASQPELLLKYFDGKHETFGFCQGFVAQIRANEITFNRYTTQ